MLQGSTSNQEFPVGNLFADQGISVQENFERTGSGVIASDTGARGFEKVPSPFA
jgi:hypothetical protein